MPRKRKTTGEAASNGGAASPEVTPETEPTPLSRYQQRKAGLLIKRDRRARFNR